MPEDASRFRKTFLNLSKKNVKGNITFDELELFKLKWNQIFT